MLCSVWAVPESRKINNGETINEKMHADIVTIAHLSIVEVEDLARFNSVGYIERFNISHSIGVRFSASIPSHARSLVIAIEQFFKRGAALKSTMAPLLFGLVPEPSCGSSAADYS
jgi:hypothetical protein